MAPKIENVSDTALWVATFRAKESERPDALFRDPLAGVLAGERGREIAAHMSYGGIMGWVMTIRTVAIDRLIQEALSRGVDTVINLGTGLDTRPYRMPLPSTLRWIEVDFPPIITLKNERLEKEVPRCKLERIPLDLSNRKTRTDLFERLSSESGKALVITEGVLPYLDESDVESLAKDLLSQPTFEFWIQDFYNGSHRVPRRWRKGLASAPFKFKVPDWFAFFELLGWLPESTIFTAEEG